MAQQPRKPGILTDLLRAENAGKVIGLLMTVIGMP
jgi:hypothetical protein